MVLLISLQFVLSSSEDDEDDADLLASEQLNGQGIDGEHDYEEEEGENQLIDIDSTIGDATDDENYNSDINGTIDDNNHGISLINDDGSSTLNGTFDASTVTSGEGNARKRTSQDYSFEMNIDDRPSRRPRLQSEKVNDKKVVISKTVLVTIRVMYLQIVCRNNAQIDDLNANDTVP